MFTQKILSHSKKNLSHPHIHVLNVSDLRHAAVTGLLSLVLEERPEVTIGHVWQHNQWKMVCCVKTDSQ